MLSEKVQLLSFDIEEHWRSYQMRGYDFVQEDVDDIAAIEWLLDLLKEQRITATFFVLSEFAERHPNLIGEIAANGHEIASHSHAHWMLNFHTPATFQEDLSKSKAILESIIGKEVKGFRAPFWSLTKESMWVLEILADLGFQYDSSIYPGFFHRFGVPGFSSEPKKYLLPSKREIWEFPAARIGWGRFDTQVCGGFYWRLFPDFVSNRCAVRSTSMWYFHPFDLTESSPIPRSIPLHVRFFKKVGTQNSRQRFKRLLSLFRFSSLKAYLENDMSSKPQNSMELSFDR